MAETNCNGGFGSYNDTGLYNVCSFLKDLRGNGRSVAVGLPSNRSIYLLYA